MRGWASAFVWGEGRRSRLHPRFSSRLGARADGPSPPTLAPSKTPQALQRADQIAHSSGKADGTYWYAPIVADAEAGFGGNLNAYELMRALIKARLAFGGPWEGCLRGAFWGWRGHSWERHGRVCQAQTAPLRPDSNAVSSSQPPTRTAGGRRGRAL